MGMGSFCFASAQKRWDPKEYQFLNNRLWETVERMIVQKKMQEIPQEKKRKQVNRTQITMNKLSTRNNYKWHTVLMKIRKSLDKKKRKYAL